MLASSAGIPAMAVVIKTFIKIACFSSLCAISCIITLSRDSIPVRSQYIVGYFSRDSFKGPPAKPIPPSCRLIAGLLRGSRSLESALGVLECSRLSSFFLPTSSGRGPPLGACLALSADALLRG